MGVAGRINKFGDNGLLCDRAHSAQPGGRGGGGEGLNWAPCWQNLLPLYCEMLHLYSIFNFR